MPPPTVLIVEENPLTRNMVRVALESENYTILEAGDGQTAIDLMLSHAPQMIVQDLLLPDMDGFDLLQRLRALPGGGGIPILALSGYLSKLEQARSLQIGFTDYLFKPVEPSQLIDTIKTYVPSDHAIQEGPGAGRRILVAGDDPIQLRLLEIQLEQEGFQVSTARDGKEALDQARISPPDAILTDVLMPCLDGFSLCSAIRQDPELAHLPVVLFTAAYIEETDRHLAQSVGASAFVLHTQDLDEVSEVLRLSLDDQVLPLPKGAIEMPIEAYTHRLIRGLERQACLSSTFVPRLALQEAMLVILAWLAEALTNPSTTEAVLDELLYCLLDAAGVSHGIAYLLEPAGGLSLRSHLGFGLDAEDPLRLFFGQSPLLLEAMDERSPVQMPSARMSDHRVRDLLERAGVRSMAIVPLVSGDECLGALVLASSSRQLGEEWLPFLRIVGSHAGQTLHLARATIERRRLEEELRQHAAALAAADRRKDQFLAMLAHELRNPLGAISNALAVLRLREATEDTAVLRAREIQERQVRHMTRLVDDLLDVSRLAEGKIKLRKEPVELAALVAQAVQTTTPQIDARGHEFLVSLPPGHVRLEGDPTRLGQVLVNLIQNAAKYTELGGCICLIAEMEGDAAAPWVVLRVRDTGVGIAPELLPHIFDLFTQEERSLDRAQGGLGIGLTLVRRLVEMHGGSVEAHSDGPGQGSEFIVRLPAGACEAGEGDSEERAPGRIGDSSDHSLLAPVSLRVLVVDDNVDGAQILAELLHVAGHQTHVAHDGVTAIAVARLYHPEVILLEIGLTGMDGYEVARQIRQEAGLCGALLVAVSGYGCEEDRRRSREAGLDHHLVKPVDLEDLQQILSTAAGSSFAATAPVSAPYEREGRPRQF